MGKTKRKTTVLFIYLCVTLGFSLNFVQSKKEFPFVLENQLSSTELDHEILFEYGFSFSREVFNFEISNLNLDIFNSLTLFFIVSGDKSNTDGLNVTFILNDTEITFIIDRLFQDNLGYNLTETFFLSNPFQGKMNVTVICEGKSTLGQPGTLNILSNSFFEIIPIPDLYETEMNIPSVPNWFLFQGNVFSSKTRSIVTGVNHFNGDYKINMSISFFSDNFNAMEQIARIYINRNLSESTSFQDGMYQQFHYTSSLLEGLNIIEIEFVISNSQDLINLYNIQITGKAYCLLNELPPNTFDYVYWENQLDYTFDLSPFKPETSEKEFILYIDLHYGCIGDEIKPSINYELYSYVFSIFQGKLTLDEQRELIKIEKIKSMTQLFQEDLTLRISGTTVGEGIFFLLNTTFIQLEPIPTINNETLTRFLASEKVIDSSEHEYSECSFNDFIYINENAIYKWKLSFSFEIITGVNTAIRDLEIVIKKHDGLGLSDLKRKEFLEEFSHLFEKKKE